MCHDSVLTWAAEVFGPGLVTSKTVCEVGAYNVNGTVRPLIEAHQPESYLGVDIETGPGVDLVANVEDLPDRFPDGFDLVVSTEMLEHVFDWRAAIRSLVRLVAKGGALAVTTRSPGFPYHPYPIDMWRYPVPLMVQILESSGLKIVSCEADPEQAGVFAVATKPKTWREPKAWLDDIEIPGV
jgi:SAM-dependent methyltransferase